MSLSTLLEAAKYLDFLDSSSPSSNSTSTRNNNNTDNAAAARQLSTSFNHHHQLLQQPQQNDAQSGRISIRKKSPRRPRASRKGSHQNNNNNNGSMDMIAMSLPTSVSFATDQHLHQHQHQHQQQRGGGPGVPIPNSAHFAPYSSSKSPPASGLSCSYTGTGGGSPLSSPTSIALLSSKTSGVTSNISSAASSLSSSDSSSSCGEILMSELDFNQCATSLSSTCSISVAKNPTQISHTINNPNIELLTNIQQLNNNNNNNQLTHHNYHQQLPFDATQNSSTYYGLTKPTGSMPQPITGGTDKRAPARRKNSKSSSTSNYVTTMASDQCGFASTSVPLDGTLHGHHAGRVFHATGSHSSSNQLKFAAHQSPSSFNNRGGSGSAVDIHGASTSTYMSMPQFGTVIGSGGILNQTTRSPTGSLIMARVQPMILNSLAPSAHQSIMAFQQATAPSPTSTPSSYSRHRELHKTLEKNRRAHLRHCFELLKSELPGSDCVDRKTSHINIIKSAIRCVLSLIEQGARLEVELQRQMEIKSRLTNQLANFKDNNNLSSNQQPVAEQQLSFLLSQSKID